LEDLEFVASSADAALFRSTVDGETIWLLVWVDDILVAAQGEEQVAKVKAHLTAKFDMRDLRPATYFLGMELSRDRKAQSLKLTQKKLTRELSAGMDWQMHARAQCHWQWGRNSERRGSPWTQ
jgi:hypothetical protein